MSIPYRLNWRTIAGKCFSSVPRPCSRSNNGVSSQTPIRPVTVRTPRPSSHSRMIEEETTSRVSSSFTNRSPLALTRWPHSDRMPSVTSAPINCSGYTAPVGWCWKVSICSSLAPIRYDVHAGCLFMVGARRAVPLFLPHVVREQHRRTDRKGARVLPRLGPEPHEVLQRQLMLFPDYERK